MFDRDFCFQCADVLAEYRRLDHAPSSTRTGACGLVLWQVQSRLYLVYPPLYRLCEFPDRCQIVGDWGIYCGVNCDCIYVQSGTDWFYP